MAHTVDDVLRHPPAWLRVLGGLLGTMGFLGLAALGSGSVSVLLAHPARIAACVVSLGLAVVAGFAPFNLSAGRREDTGNRWILVPFLLLTALMGWLPAFCDRHELLTLDGDLVRWIGVALVAVGGVLRIWPMFVLGRRFSGLVAVQEGHQLATDGLYRVIRHPSYLGGILFMVGWPLVFRSLLGLVLNVPAGWLMVARMDAEEALLAAEFGAQYAAYRARTWRLVPFIY